MRIAARYSFNNGEEKITKKFPKLLSEIEDVIRDIDAHQLKTKKSEEKTKQLRMLFDPQALNNAFKAGFKDKGGWKPVKVPCVYSDEYYVDGYKPTRIRGKGAFREMDFVKDQLGVEVQFGKYAFMVYNVCAKMTIFKNLGHIQCGVEIVPVRGFTVEMSTGVAYFEQFTWDLKMRGVGNIDIPVLILGIDADVLIDRESETPAGDEPGEILQGSLIR
jgi:hypothetical protein